MITLAELEPDSPRAGAPRPAFPSPAALGRIREQVALTGLSPRAQIRAAAWLLGADLRAIDPEALDAGEAAWRACDAFLAARIPDGEAEELLDRRLMHALLATGLFEPVPTAASRLRTAMGAVLVLAVLGFGAWVQIVAWPDAIDLPPRPFVAGDRP